MVAVVVVVVVVVAEMRPSSKDRSGCGTLGIVGYRFGLVLHGGVMQWMGHVSGVKYN